MAAKQLASHQAIRIQHHPAAEAYVGSSLQFLLPDISNVDAHNLVAQQAQNGIEVKRVGAQEPVGLTSSHHSGCFTTQQDLPSTNENLAGLLDLRLLLAFSLDDCCLLAEHILKQVSQLDLEEEK